MIGYKQKRNRYFVSVYYPETNRVEIPVFGREGFKSKKQFSDWMKEQHEHSKIEWQVGTLWKFKGCDTLYKLTDSNGYMIN